MIYSSLCSLLTSSLLCYHTSMGITLKLFNSQLTFSVRLFCKHVSPRSCFFLQLFSDFLFCLRHPTVITFCSQQKMMNDVDWICFLVFTKIYFLLSTQNDFSFQQKTFLVFITEHILFSPQFVFWCQLKSFSVFNQNHFLVSSRNHFLLSPKINFGCHRKSILVFIQNLYLLSTEIKFSFQPPY